MIESTQLSSLVDLVIAITVVEFAALLVYHRATGRGVAPREFAANMVSGLLLMAALRCFAHDAAAWWTVLCLLGAGAAHTTDLWMRWRREPRAARTTRRVIA